MDQPTESTNAVPFSRIVRTAILASGIVVSWTVIAVGGYVIFKLSPFALY